LSKMFSIRFENRGEWILPLWGFTVSIVINFCFKVLKFV
jgi:hypothetical protein